MIRRWLTPSWTGWSTRRTRWRSKANPCASARQPTPRNGHRDHLRYNLLTAQYHLPSLITFAETADHLHRNPQLWILEGWKPAMRSCDDKAFRDAPSSSIVLLAHGHLARVGPDVRAADRTRHGDQTAHADAVAAWAGMHLLFGVVHYPRGGHC
ncbi:hypothetical protein CBM2633_P350005 [Cupriavidus taiwanensis]|uniref:Uncharacterized protein n=3 Tax=Cupriavidus TaxID=106589 RepID=A0A375DAM4_9BURK|nr:hypothetical protein CBM2585_P350001 [Cupriavidus taiwanensis]SOZ40643.1 hypothetical protein CBM2605_P350004 [Cupriavidus neocaledonicus]SOY75949.1 hypothetical protein CBM2588_P390001 [Cupriavidus taiwanensis]SOY75981.1 hypothetical protein CBM2592_P380004 [Cupriavidus taiwanensis]SOY78019.1 hypothetical protein CBM2586_P360002 [Cupriavidus taiwanensis]